MESGIEVGGCFEAQCSWCSLEHFPTGLVSHSLEYHVRREADTWSRGCGLLPSSCDSVLSGFLLPLGVGERFLVLLQKLLRDL